ncbi:DUF2306 domain-containing protein [Undibacterium sp. Di24W]
MKTIPFTPNLSTSTNEDSRAKIRLYWKYALFAMLAFLFIWVMLQIELPMLLGLNPEWEHKVKSYIVILHLHATAGTIALLVAPLQFIFPLRATKPHLHRLLGRLYAAAIGIAAPLAMWIAVFHLAPGETWAALAQAIVWLYSTIAAVVAAMKHQLAAHRLWIMRSYALTFTFVISRFMIDVMHLPMNAQLGGPNTFIVELSIIAFVVAQWFSAKHSKETKSELLV